MANLIPTLIPALLLAEGIICGLVAVVTYRKKTEKLAHMQRAWGEVIAVNEREGGEGATKHPVIRYKTIGGKEVIFESKFGRSGWNIKPGDKLEILASPTNPEDAEVANFMAQWGVPLIFGAASAMSLVSAPLLYFFLSRSH